MSHQLEALRAQVAERKQGIKKGRKKVWHEPEVDDFAQGWVLAFDQTLTKTGWVVLVNNRLDTNGIADWVVPGIHIRAGGVLRPEANNLRSFEQTLAKAESMSRVIDLVVKQYQWVDAIVHEMPAVAGYRLESSLMAAREIRRAVGDRRPVAMISRQSAYSTLTGQGSSEKSKMTKAVNRLVPKEDRITECWTQDVHDAAGLALKYLYDKKQESHG